MLPISKAIPKEMILVGQKPMIQYAVEETVDYGIETIVIIINPEKEIIKKLFLEKSHEEHLSEKTVSELSEISSKADIVFLYQDQPKGLADAISLSREIIKEDPFALLLPDNIFFSDISPLKSLAAVFNNYNKDVGALIKITPEEFKLFGNCGKVQLEKITEQIHSIKDLKSKEKGYFNSHSSGLITRGFARHILFPHFFEYIDRIRSITKGELDDVPVFQLMIKEKGLLGCYLEGKGYDTGNPSGYQAANRFAQMNVNKPIT